MSGPTFKQMQDTGVRVRLFFIVSVIGALIGASVGAFVEFRLWHHGFDGLSVAVQMLLSKTALAAAFEPLQWAAAYLTDHPKTDAFYTQAWSRVGMVWTPISAAAAVVGLAVAFNKKDVKE